HRSPPGLRRAAAPLAAGGLRRAALHRADAAGRAGGHGGRRPDGRDQRGPPGGRDPGAVRPRAARPHPRAAREADRGGAREGAGPSPAPSGAPEELTSYAASDDHAPATSRPLPWLAGLLSLALNLSGSTWGLPARWH